MIAIERAGLALAALAQRPVRITDRPTALLEGLAGSQTAGGATRPIFILTDPGHRATAW
jgi:hypothetical protein